MEIVEGRSYCEYKSSKSEVISLGIFFLIMWEGCLYDTSLWSPSRSRRGVRNTTYERFIKEYLRSVSGTLPPEGVRTHRGVTLSTDLKGSVYSFEYSSLNKLLWVH